MKFDLLYGVFKSSLSVFQKCARPKLCDGIKPKEKPGFAQAWFNPKVIYAEV